MSHLDAAGKSEGAPKRQEIYTFGYTSASMQMMASRTAEVHASFFLPHLRVGMRLLDCGCGPGSITVGLAEAIAPGEAVGIDIEPAQLDFARTHAARKGITNVRFEVEDICNLSFPDSSFDAVFGHTILMQFKDPSPALAEVRRVLKPGGIVGFREPIFSSNLAEPPDSAQHQVLKLFARVLAHNGGDIDIGRRVAGLLQSIGFDLAMMSASFSGGWTPEAKRTHCELWAQLCAEADFMNQAIALGWIASDVRATMVSSLRANGDDPLHFFATAWREILGRKPA